MTNVAFSIVSRLFRFVNTEMLYYPRLGERFVALTCVLVELYPARLLSLPAQQKQNFIDSLCFAAQHHDKDVLEGALDAIASLACFLQSGSEQQLQRFTQLIFAVSCQDEIVESAMPAKDSSQGAPSQGVAETAVA